MHPPFGSALFYLRRIATQHQDLGNLLGRHCLAVPAADPGRDLDLLAGLGHLLARQRPQGRSTTIEIKIPMPQMPSPFDAATPKF